MRRSFRIIGCVLLALALSSPAWAGHGKGGGGESQAGGLPGLEDRVEGDEALITTLQGQVAALQGQNNWAVVNEVAGVASVVRSSSVPGPVSATQLGVGLVDV